MIVYEFRQNYIKALEKNILSYVISLVPDYAESSLSTIVAHDSV